MPTVTIEIWRAGSVIGHETSDRDRIVIGADPTCDIVVTGASAKHVVLERHSRGTDVKAYAGEHLVHNGRALTPMERQTIWAGDVLELGELSLILDVGGAPAPPAKTRADHDSHARVQHALVVLLEHVEAVRPEVLVALEATLLEHAEPLAAPAVLADWIATRRTPPEESRVALCRAIARHNTLDTLLPRIADAPGYAKAAARAYSYVPAERRAALAPAMLGHPYWQTRLYSALSLRDLAARECALRAVRRSFVASQFSSPVPTMGPRPARPIVVDVGPSLPPLPAPQDIAASGCADLIAWSTQGQPAAEPGPLVFDAADLQLIEAARREALAAARA